MQGGANLEIIIFDLRSKGGSCVFDSNMFMYAPSLRFSTHESFSLHLSDAQKGVGNGYLRMKLGSAKKTL